MDPLRPSSTLIRTCMPWEKGARFRTNLTQSEIQGGEIVCHWWQFELDLWVFLTLWSDGDISGKISPLVYAIKSNNTTQRHPIVSEMRGCHAYGCSGSSGVVLWYFNKCRSYSLHLRNCRCSCWSVRRPRYEKANSHLMKSSILFLGGVDNDYILQQKIR